MQASLTQLISVDSSVHMLNFVLIKHSNKYSLFVLPITFFIIDVDFVLFNWMFLRTSDSGSRFFINCDKWSIARNGIMCYAIKATRFILADFTFCINGVNYGEKDTITDGVLETLLELKLCFLLCK